MGAFSKTFGRAPQGALLNQFTRTIENIATSFCESNRDSSTDNYCLLIGSTDINLDYKNYLTYKLLINL